MPPRTGRPPTTGETRNEVLRVRVSEAERERMQAAADRAEQPLAVWMHDRLIAAAKRAR